VRFFFFHLPILSLTNPPPDITAHKTLNFTILPTASLDRKANRSLRYTVTQVTVLPTSPDFKVMISLSASRPAPPALSRRLNSYTLCAAHIMF